MTLCEKYRMGIEKKIIYPINEYAILKKHWHYYFGFRPFKIYLNTRHEEKCQHFEFLENKGLNGP